MSGEKIFISYSRRDIVAVQAIYDKLRGAYYSVWMDKSEIEGGKDWWESIKTGIEVSHVVMIFVSQDWIESDVCKDEFEYARQQGKQTLLFIVRPIKDFSLIPQEIARLHMHHLYTDPDLGYQNLLRELERLNIFPDIPPSINPNNFGFLYYPDEIKSIVAMDDSDKRVLWLVGELGDQHFLYRLNTREQHPTFHLVGQLPANFRSLHVDSNGNVWINMVEHGTVIYPADLMEIKADGNYTHLNQESIGDFAHGVHAIASYRQGDEVIVWLGKESIQQLSYKTSYPQIADITCHEASYTAEDETAVHRLVFDEAKQILWAYLYKEGLLRLHLPRGEKSLFPLDGDMVMMQAGDNHTLWLASKEHFIQISETGEILRQLPPEETLSIEPYAAAVTQEMFWYGSPSHSYLHYNPLWYLTEDGSMKPIPLRVHDVHLMHWQASAKILWLATDRGLISYSFGK
jgi:hypothetical protein